jgi:transcriptional regulator with XRE-family HTH domain
MRPTIRVPVRPEPDPDTPGAKIRNLRKRKGWTQEQLGALAGVPQETISAIERNARNAGPQAQSRIAFALDVRVGRIWPAPKRNGKK